MSRERELEHELEEVVKPHGTRRTQLGEPIAEAEIQSAERTLGVRFPVSFRTFLLRWGGGLVLDLEIYGIPSEATRISRFSGDSTTGSNLEDDNFVFSILRANQRRDRRVPRHLIQFTSDGADTYFYLDVSRMDSANECPAVVLASDGSVHTFATSFLDFLKKIRNA